MKRAAAFVLLLGCGINEEGERDVIVDGSTEAGDVTIDVVKDAPPPVCADAGAASCADAVAFRSPALYSPDAGAPCPPGYDTHDLVLSVATSDHCACNCTDAGAPSCDTSKANYHYGVGTCGTSGSAALSGSCTAISNTTFAGESLQVDTPAVTGGCAGGTSAPPGAANTNVRLCTPQCASDESVCAGANGLRACVAVPGQVASCPSTYPVGPFDIGANPTITCDTCSCTATGDCTGSTLHLYGNGSCGGGDQSFPMDSTCHLLNGGQIGVFGGAAVNPNFKGNSYACQVNAGLSHTTYGGNEFTVCCQ
jgi:hypothetical protein